MYALIDPRDLTVRYIGRSLEVSKRMAAHLGAHTNVRRTKWVAELRAAGLTPTSIILERCAKRACVEAEGRWTRHYAQHGTVYNARNSERNGKVVDERTARHNRRTDKMVVNLNRKTRSIFERAAAHDDRNLANWVMVICARAARKELGIRGRIL